MRIFQSWCWEQVQKLKGLDRVKQIKSVSSEGRSQIDVEFIPGTDRKLCYCEDPFGNVIEIFSHSYEQTFANWPNEGRDAE